MKQRSPYGGHRRRAQRAAQLGQPETWGHATVVRLTLPLPPSLNAVLGWGPGRIIREKLAYKRRAWIDACQQSPPPHPESIPQQVHIAATLYVTKRMDEDALAARLKWPLDVLKWKQQGPAAWKQGVCDERAYIWDDDSAHCTLALPLQVVDRKRPRVELVIEAVQLRAERRAG